jgi:hypothetical protein
VYRVASGYNFSIAIYCALPSFVLDFLLLNVTLGGTILARLCFTCPVLLHQKSALQLASPLKPLPPSGITPCHLMDIKALKALARIVLGNKTRCHRHLYQVAIECVHRLAVERLRHA